LIFNHLWSKLRCLSDAGSAFALSRGKPERDGAWMQPMARTGETARVWTIRKGATFECADSGRQTSRTTRTVLDKTRKPLKIFHRDIFEVSTWRTSISAKDLQRTMSVGSYETAWTSLHKLRSAMVRSQNEPLGPFVEMNEP
jgi:hypothetical protein